MMHPHLEEKKDDYENDVSTIKTYYDYAPQSTSSDDDDDIVTTRGTNKNCNETRGYNNSRPLLLLLCATGITSCYLWYGTVQEHLFQLDNASTNNNKGDDDGNKQSITLFLLATGTFSSCLLALIWIVVGPLLLAQSSKSSDHSNTKNNRNRQNRHDDEAEQEDGRLNHPLLTLTSITYLSAMAASNESLHYVSYPTCVLAKSSKLIPTMVVGWLVDKYRSYWQRDISNNNSNNTSSSNLATNHKGINGMEWLGAALITIGILSFQYIQLQKQTNNDSSHHHLNDTQEKGDSPYGLALLGLSLFMDGLLGACQSTLKQQTHHTQKSSSSSTFRPPSAMETMLYINLYATLILIPCSYYAGQFQQGMSMLFPSADSSSIINTHHQAHHHHTSKLLLQLNLSASLGQVFIFLTIHHFSPLTCTTVTTTRKFFTILLSVYKFGHVLDVWQWSSVGLVFGGLYLEIVAKFIGEKGDDDDKKEKED